MVGSDVEHFYCPYCRSHDRERHLFMFFDKLEIWNRFANAQVLHFAPERHIAARLQRERPAVYN